MMTCPICGVAIKVRKDQHELDARADHSTLHNPSPAQWKVAHDLMQAAKPKKESEGVRG